MNQTVAKHPLTVTLYTEAGEWMQEWKDVRHVDLIGDGASEMTLIDGRHVLTRGGIIVAEENA